MTPTRKSIRQTAKVLACLILATVAIPLISPEASHAVNAGAAVTEDIRLTLDGPRTFRPGDTVSLSGRLEYSNQDLGLPFQIVELELRTITTSLTIPAIGLEVENNPTNKKFYRTLTDQNGQFTARPRLTEPFHYEVVARWGSSTIRETASRSELPIELSSDPTEFLESETLRLSPLVAVTLEFVGDGAGSISSDPGIFACSNANSCVRDVVLGTPINLTPAPSDDSAFVGWSSNCPASQRTCRITIEQTTTVTARFAKAFKEIAAGDRHACGLLTGGSVGCWGKNDAGQIGTNRQNVLTTPSVVQGIANASSIAAGGSHTCALIADGTVQCWGEGSSGQLGNGAFQKSASPQPVAGLSGVKAIGAGGAHSCALIANGSVQCWGEGSSGQLGNGAFERSPSPQPVTGLSEVKAIAAGGAHTCALIAKGGIRCWGEGSSGQLGNKSKTRSNRPTNFIALVTATAVSLSGNHSCALTADGTAKCWGEGSSGQLGDGTYLDRGSPVSVKELPQATQLALGTSFTCAVVPDGAHACFGNGIDGQLGDGTRISKASPTTYAVVGDLEITAGQYHSCVLRSDGSATCRGANSLGELGDGTTDDSGLHSAGVVEVRDVENLVAIEAGRHHTCAIDGVGLVSCWRSGYEGQLGEAAVSTTTRPVSVQGIEGATSVSAGDRHSCAVRADGSVWCWGDNSKGQLGNGLTISSARPVHVAGLEGAGSVEAGGSHTCAVLADGSVECWGDGTMQQIGQSISSTLPIKVQGIQRATAISSGGNHTCALEASGNLKCFGANYAGQVDGTPSESSDVVAVGGVNHSVHLSAGQSHSCALSSNGSVSCWGANWTGQLGVDPRGEDIDGHSESQQWTSSVTETVQYARALAAGGLATCWLGAASQCTKMITVGFVPVPQEVATLDKAVQVSSGGSHSCARLSDATIACWGSNDYGQLGDGSRIGSALPKVVNLDPALEVAAGGQHTCALLETKKIACWGDNTWGQLGNGSTETSDTPGEVIGITNAKSLSAGGKHTCALLDDESISCWGFNGDDQLGNPTVPDRWACPDYQCAQSNEPVLVHDVSAARQISAGEDHTCAVLNSGKIMCWGWNFDGQLGTESVPARPTCGEPCDGSLLSSPAVTVTAIDNAIEVSAGMSHSCAREMQGTVRCWGSNSLGQLGDGTFDNWSPTPRAVSNLDNAVSVSAGSFHSCASIAAERVTCWGWGLQGELGTGSITQTTVPALTVDFGQPTQVDAGSSHMCVVTDDARVRCWGLATSGRLGDGPDPIPAWRSMLPGMTDGVMISAGDSHTCAVDASGTPWCWGSNEVGQLGSGTTATSGFPVPVATLGPFGGYEISVKEISAGASHSCALTQAARVYCWGANWSGQLGIGTISDHDPRNGIFGGSVIPVRTLIDEDVTDIESGGDYSCAITRLRKLYCWGSNDAQTESNPTPTEIATDFVDSVSIGGDHACLTIGGSVKCWGDNTYRQLGPDPNPPTDRPVSVPLFHPALSIAAGGEHTCAITDDGSENPVYCWGRNHHGQLGIGNVSYAEHPRKVENLPPSVKAIAAGALHTCVLFEETVTCWGNNQGLELGLYEGDHDVCNSRRTCVSEPRVATPVFYAVAVEAGGQHSCALLFEGTVTCWGSNEQQQLGPQADSNGAGITIHQREWEYSGPTLVSGCDEVQYSGGHCWKNIGADATKISVEVKESGTSCPPPSLGDCAFGDESLTVAGLVTFLDVSDKPLGSKSFCGTGRFTIPSGTESLSIELYEGAADAPITLQRACTISTPISGTTTITLTGRCRQLLCVVLEDLPGS